MSEGHKESCYYCQKTCNALAGNPGEWPIPMCHRDEPGVVKWHHVGCVMAKIAESERLEELTTARAESAVLLEKAAAILENFAKQLLTSFPMDKAGALNLKQYAKVVRSLITTDHATALKEREEAAFKRGFENAAAIGGRELAEHDDKLLADFVSRTFPPVPGGYVAGLDVAERERKARLAEAKWWEHLVGNLHPDHSEEPEEECMYCQRILSLSAAAELGKV